MPYAVEMQDIVIRFPGVLANDHVNFTLEKGEIHALLGENGAGKSTLMNVLSGLYKPSSGTIRVDGKIVNFNSPRDAISSGIGMVHQHFMLVPTQTVTENILLGLKHPRFFMNLARYEREILDLTAALRSARRPQGQDLAAFRRRTATRRDSQDALPRRRCADLWTNRPPCWPRRRSTN